MAGGRREPHDDLLKADIATTTRPGTSGLCRSWLALVECLDYCKTLHSQTLRNAEVLEVAGLVSCRLRACELVECLAELVRRLLEVPCSNGRCNGWR